MLDQVPGRRGRRGPFVHAHVRHAGRRTRFTEDHHRDLARRLIEPRVAALHAVEHEAVDLMLQERVHELGLARLIVGRIAEQQAEAPAESFVFDGVRERGDEGVGDVGHDEPVRPRGTRGQRPGHSVRAVSGRFDGGEHAPSGPVGDRPWPVVHDIAHDGDGRTGHSGHLGPRHLASAHPALLSSARGGTSSVASWIRLRLRPRVSGATKVVTNPMPAIRTLYSASGHHAPNAASRADATAGAVPPERIEPSSLANAILVNRFLAPKSSTPYAAWTPKMPSEAMHIPTMMMTITTTGSRESSRANAGNAYATSRMQNPR